MNLLDLGIVVLLILIVLRGYYRGLFQELAVLAGVVGGVLAAAHTHALLAAKLSPWISNPDHARWLAFALVLVAVYWSIRFLAYFLQRILYHLYLDVFDRLLGGFFALVKGALLLGFALMAVGLVMPRDSHLLKGSRTAPYLVHFSRQALGLLPPDFKQRLNDYLQRWQKPNKKREHALSPEDKRGHLSSKFTS
jgi:membrane protein required for colicin V production